MKNWTHRERTTGGPMCKKQGWATMPGEKDPDSRVAGEVADPLARLKL
jgi:hypothetical protein